MKKAKGQLTHEDGPGEVRLKAFAAGATAVGTAAVGWVGLVALAIGAIAVGADRCPLSIVTCPLVRSVH